jgi:hypothetical protein
MMQPCASAAKLLDDGPILQTRLTSHGVVRVTVTSVPDRQRLCRDRRTNAFFSGFDAGRWYSCRGSQDDTFR